MLIDIGNALYENINKADRKYKPRAKARNTKPSRNERSAARFGLYGHGGRSWEKE